MHKVLDALTEAARQEPDLAPYYEMHRTLLELQGEARDGISASLELSDEGALQARLAQGLPLITFEQLPIEAEQFAAQATRLAQVLTEYEVEVGKRTPPADAEEWLDLARQRFDDGQWAEAREAMPEVRTLAQTATDLALSPYLEWAADRVLPHIDQEHWKRGYCPVCGAAPDFAFLDNETGARHLVCPRCSSQWLYRRLECPFCGTNDHERLSYYLDEKGVYRLYVCQNCQHYLKAIDLRQVGRPVLFPVERLKTLNMDLAARRQGYR